MAMAVSPLERVSLSSVCSCSLVSSIGNLGFRAPAHLSMSSSDILPLVSHLSSASPHLVTHAASQLRLLSNLHPHLRLPIARSGALPLLLNLLLSSPDPFLQENSITALLNVSISDPVKLLIFHSSPSSLDAILHALSRGHSAVARANAAALLFSLMAVEDLRPLIGQKAGVIEALLDLLRDRSVRGRKDSLKALFHISLCAENRPFLVKCGAVPVLVSLLMQDQSGLAEDALAVLSQTAACTESVDALSETSAIPLIAGLLDTGTKRARENAASALLNFCTSGGSGAVELVQDARCLNSLYAMMETGSARGKRKASSVLQILLTH